MEDDADAISHFLLAYVKDESVDTLPEPFKRFAAEQKIAGGARLLSSRPTGAESRIDKYAIGFLKRLIPGRKRVSSAHPLLFTRMQVTFQRFHLFLLRLFLVHHSYCVDKVNAISTNRPHSFWGRFNPHVVHSGQRSAEIIAPFAGDAVYVDFLQSTSADGVDPPIAPHESFKSTVDHIVAVNQRMEDATLFGCWKRVMASSSSASASSAASAPAPTPAPAPALERGADQSVPMLPLKVPLSHGDLLSDHNSLLVEVPKSEQKTLVVS
jgi:hypothetical protein